MKKSQITINRNVPVLDENGKKTKDSETGYNVTEAISFKGTQIDFANGLQFVPDYGNDKRCPVQTACKLSGQYTKLIRNNLKALNMNYCFSADVYKGAYFGTKKTDVQAVMSYLQSIKADNNWQSKVKAQDTKRKDDKKASKRGEAIKKVGAKGDVIQEEQNLFTLKVEKIMSLSISDDKKAELIASL